MNGQQNGEASVFDTKDIAERLLMEQKQQEHGKSVDSLAASLPVNQSEQAALDVARQRTNDTSPAAIYLDVPFKQKDEAKAMGARWDRQAQSWYVPAGVDPSAFAQWIPANKEGRKATHAIAADRQLNHERQYLAVPYGEHQAAKAAGALWDKAAKSWYVGPNGDATKLKRWLPDNIASQYQQAPAISPREEFAEALRSVGAIVDGAHPIMDGSKHRIRVEGDKQGEQAGFYVGYLDGYPAGYVKNNRTGIEMKWKSKGYTLDPAAKANLQAEAAEKLRARAEEEARQHEQTAQRIEKQMTDLVRPTSPTPYLKGKQISVKHGVLTDKEGKKTYIPAYDENGKVWTMQYIQEDGAKRFAKNSRKEGCFHAIRGLDELSKAPAIVIAEGYATASSLSEALGFSTVAAFDSGNLPYVAKALHAKFPNKPIVIAGDNDLHLVKLYGTNPGKEKAEEAAKAVGGKAFFPIFAPGEQTDSSKDFKDFNDLATKSVLGKSGIERQVKAVVLMTIEKHQANKMPIKKGKLAQRQEPQHVAIRQ